MRSRSLALLTSPSHHNSNPYWPKENAMPKAVIDTVEERYELNSLPEGFVVLKRLPYGDWLKRQEMAMQMTFEGNRKAGMKGKMDMMNYNTTVFEFSRCIVDHNLEDASGNKLDFNNPATLAALDPRVGNEISDQIRNLHEFDEGNS